MLSSDEFAEGMVKDRVVMGMEATVRVRQALFCYGITAACGLRRNDALTQDSFAEMMSLSADLNAVQAFRLFKALEAATGQTGFLKIQRVCELVAWDTLPGAEAELQ